MKTLYHLLWLENGPISLGLDTDETRTNSIMCQDVAHCWRMTCEVEIPVTDATDTFMGKSVCNL